MTKFKALIFDLDGVIVDTAKSHYLGWQRIANLLDFTFSEKQNEALKGLSRIDSLEQLLDVGKVKLNSTQKKKYLVLKNDWHLEQIEELRPFNALPGMLPFIEDSKTKGYKIALGSSSKNALAVLNKLQMANLFDACVDGNDVSISKPHPKVFLQGARALNIQPECCIVFEDSVAGIMAAKTCGMRAVGIGDESILHQADKVYPSLMGLKIDDILIHLNKKN